MVIGQSNEVDFFVRHALQMLQHDHHGAVLFIGDGVRAVAESGGVAEADAANELDGVFIFAADNIGEHLGALFQVSPLLSIHKIKYPIISDA